MTNQEKIMDKIRALLEKTVENGASQEEAIAAAKMAQKLMAKYKIEEVKTPEPEEIDSTEFELMRQWQAELANVLAKNLCCRCIRSTDNGKSRIITMGKAQDREVWRQMFESFFVLIYNGIKAEKKKAKENFGHCRDVELAYARGFIQAVNEAMGEQCRALALVVPDEVNKATRERFPYLSHRTARALNGSAATGAARATGYSDGRAAAGQKRIAG